MNQVENVAIVTACSIIETCVNEYGMVELPLLPQKDIDIALGNLSSDYSVYDLVDKLVSEKRIKKLEYQDQQNQGLGGTRTILFSLKSEPELF